MKYPGLDKPGYAGDVAKEARLIHRALAPHITCGFRLQNIGVDERNRFWVNLKSKKPYYGSLYSWRVAVKPSEVQKNHKRVAKMISEEAYEDLQRALADDREQFSPKG